MDSRRDDARKGHGTAAAGGAAPELVYPPASCAECVERWRRVGKAGQPEVNSRGKASYTACDVSLHDKAEDLWLAAHKLVYDVTPFVSLHPGGGTALLRHGGTDSTEDFDFHSHAARALWGKYQVGVLRHCKANPDPGLTCALQ